MSWHEHSSGRFDYYFAHHSSGGTEFKSVLVEGETTVRGRQGGSFDVAKGSLTFNDYILACYPAETTCCPKYWQVASI